MKEKLKRIHIVPWLLKKIRRHIPAIVLMAVLSGISAWLGVRFALASKSVVDAGISGDLGLLKKEAVRLVIIILGMLFCTEGYGIISEQVNLKLDRRLKKEYLGYVLNGDYASASSFHSGDILNRLSNDVGNICRGLTSVLQMLVGLVTGFAATIVALSGFSIKIMGVLVVAAAVMAVFLKLVSRKFMALNRDVVRSDSKVMSFFSEAVGKLLVVQGLDIAPIIEKKADELLLERYNKQRRKVLISAGFMTGLSGLSYLMEFIGLIWCAARLAAGQISFGDLTAITQLAAKLEMPFFQIPGLAKQLFSILASAERLCELESIPQNDIESKLSFNVKETYSRMKSISGEHVSFRYGRSPVLEDISFRIPKGKITVICGSSGIGKSTLLKLMLGLYTPESGRLEVRTSEESMLLDRGTRSLFTYAPQGNLLISGTIRDNLLLVNPDASDEEIRTAVYISAMDDCLSDFPEGLDTVLGENGAGISEGQAQRLSLARAWLTGAPVMLLDEITSSLDEETEKKILTRIRTVRDVTCVIVTHRRAVREIADNVIVISGKSDESGDR